jgi:pyridoxal phosphate enzyme (YggS family)
MGVTACGGIFALNPFNKMIDREAYRKILTDINGKAVLVAVSKTKTADDVLALYNEGQRDFGENYVQELLDKQALLPADINWHFIGHLQSNKVKYLIRFVHLIQGVDSLRLLAEIDRQATQSGRVVDVLLQVHIAREETKFGLDAGELRQPMEAEWKSVRIRGLMGMASDTEDVATVKGEFIKLKAMYDQWFPGGGILSMGMSGDYKIALEAGGNMVRIGSLLFGKRG